MGTRSCGTEGGTGRVHALGRMQPVLAGTYSHLPLRAFQACLRPTQSAGGHLSVCLPPAS
jgi:hypothetical protein